MSVALTVVTGLIDTRFVDLMRDPVTTISCNGPDAASVLAAVVAVSASATGMAAETVARASAARTASCSLRLFPIFLLPNVKAVSSLQSDWLAHPSRGFSQSHRSDIYYYYIT